MPTFIQTVLGEGVCPFKLKQLASVSPFMRSKCTDFPAQRLTQPNIMHNVSA